MNSINEQTLVLRFRDLSTAKGDTINLHQEVIAQKGEVWWGWWKGGADSDCEEAIYYLSEILADERSTSKDHILTLFLLDTGQDRTGCTVQNARRSCLAHWEKHLDQIILLSFQNITEQENVLLGSFYQKYRR